MFLTSQLSLHTPPVLGSSVPTYFVQGKSFCEILLHTNTTIVHPSQSKLEEGEKDIICDMSLVWWK